ncbi:hypothetical protein K7432_009767 [Basidiobolus ranarum]|uniref:TLC domain-containing protein n=1 Tax=Basidiobolus ranarum TaxID=34480 RepID=A0ABR2WPQ0_9FUNG
MSSTVSGPTLEQSIQTIFREFGFEKLAFHWKVVLLSAAACQGTFCLSRALSPLVFRKTYRSLSHAEQISWDAHAVSFLHCILIVILALPVRFEPHLRNDRVYGYSSHAGDVYAIACGYFLWDTIYYSKYIKEYGFGLLIHACSCFVLALFSYRPFVMYYGSIFLMFELSTPFLNAQWFMDKLGFVGEVKHKVNSGILVTIFFCVRIIYGFSSLYYLLVDIVPIAPTVPLHLLTIFGVALGCLHLLNILWFYKIFLRFQTLLTSEPVNKMKAS